MPDVPAGAKKPQDHKPKSADKFELEFEGESYTITKEALLDDLEVAEYLAEDRTAPLALRQILGTEDYARFKNSVRDKKTGRASAEKAGEFLDKMFEGAEEANLS
ncbi:MULTISPECIES: hypothetical protein [Brevibacterium]|uniref:Uncharacterized protein n=1 Tax=Brevibacterium antiquum CNRZ 918 TaxID=1255637 RepID=A0A2H1KEA8_9MICO|nr:MULTISPECIES: hypothetical protein [Brevibacterium]SMX98137.1 hypothetical protein BANT918_02395 [Brevibacterium antiquum CNRZ 918]HCG55327.1 hypothetical protein [Brevibacterium sp.]